MQKGLYNVGSLRERALTLARVADAADLPLPDLVQLWAGFLCSLQPPWNRHANLYDWPRLDTLLQKVYQRQGESSGSIAAHIASLERQICKLQGQILASTKPSSCNHDSWGSNPGRVLGMVFFLVYYKFLKRLPPLSPPPSPLPPCPRYVSIPTSEEGSGYSKARRT